MCQIDYELIKTMTDEYHFEFHTKIVGSTFIEENQKTLAKLKEKDTLTLKREKYNLVDPNAIAIYFENQKIGYVSASIAKKLSLEIDFGITYNVVVVKVTGSKEKNIGVNIKLQIDPSQDKSVIYEIKELIREILRLRYLYAHDAKHKYYYLMKEEKILKDLKNLSKKLLG